LEERIQLALGLGTVNLGHTDAVAVQKGVLAGRDPSECAPDPEAKLRSTIRRVQSFTASTRSLSTSCPTTRRSRFRLHPSRKPAASSSLLS
jgi:hypothetical protein